MMSTDVESELQFELEIDEKGIGSQDSTSELPDGCLARYFKPLCSDDRKNSSLDEEGIIGSQDYISELPDGCLARYFKPLSSDDRDEEGIIGSQDCISVLLDECLDLIFKSLSSADRKNVSLLSKRMLKVEAQSHRRLTLNATQLDRLPALLSRFDAVEVLVLRCNLRSEVIDVDEGLIVTGRYCANTLMELDLIGVNASCIGLEYVAANCVKLEALSLRRCKKIGDDEIRCIASEFAALKEVCIEECPVTDEGIEAFGWGCPNLVEIKVNSCMGVTSHAVDWWAKRKGSLQVNFDVPEIKANGYCLESDSSSDDDGVDIPVPVVSRRVSNGWPRLPIFRPRYENFGGRGLARGG